MTTTHPIRVVVADDDDRLREMLVGLLDDLGYEVVGAFPDGRAAIEFCAATPPDVVVLDHRMPELSGVDAVQELAAVQPGLPVVMLSAYDDAGLQHAAKQAGASTYLVKGCTAREITTALDAAVTTG